MRMRQQTTGRAGITGGGMLAAALLATSLAGPASAQASADPPRWEVGITPFAWAAGLTGTVGLRDRTADVDVTFRDLLKHLDGALMLGVEARRGHWGAELDGIYVKVSAEHGTPGPLFSGASLDVSQAIVELTPLYRLLDTRRVAVDVLAGARLWSLKNTLTLDAGALPGATLPLDKHWIDPLAGARAFVTLSSHWTLQLRGDIGGFGAGSRFSSQELAGVAYELSKHWVFRGGYRHLDVDFRQDSDGFIYDVGMGGPILGAIYRF